MMVCESSLQGTPKTVSFCCLNKPLSRSSSESPLLVWLALIPTISGTLRNFASCVVTDILAFPLIVNLRLSRSSRSLEPEGSGKVYLLIAACAYPRAAERGGKLESQGN